MIEFSEEFIEDLYKFRWCEFLRQRREIDDISVENAREQRDANTIDGDLQLPRHLRDIFVLLDVQIMKGGFSRRDFLRVQSLIVVIVRLKIVILRCFFHLAQHFGFHAQR